MSILAIKLFDRRVLQYAKYLCILPNLLPSSSAPRTMNSFNLGGTNICGNTTVLDMNFCNRNAVTKPLLVSTVWQTQTMYRHMRKRPCPDFNEKVNASTIETNVLGGNSKMGLFARYKRTYKKYWFVVIPVHIVTSIGWLSIFYLLSKSGVDIAALLQTLNFSEPVINKARDSAMGHAAIAFLCYELATPLRYVVTLGATTFCIKYFTKIGRIKSVPSHREIMRMFKQQNTERPITKKNKNGKFGEKP